MIKTLSAITVLFFIISAGYCQEQTLQLTIKSNKQAYEVGEQIQLYATIKNTGKEVIKIYSPDYPGVSEIKIIDSQGIQLKPRGVKIRRLAFERFKTINPGETKTHIYSNLQWFHYGGAWEFSGEARLKPDTYQIIVAITNPPIRFLDHESKSFENTRSGTLISNSIAIKVIEKKATHVQTYSMELKYNGDAKRHWWTFKLGENEFSTLEEMKKFIKNMPKGSKITWPLPCIRMGDEPLLSSEAEMESFKKFCGDNGVTLVVLPSG